MNWRRLAWLVILLLMVTIVLAGIELKEAYDELDSVRSDDTNSVDLNLVSLQKRIEAHRVHLSGLEKLTLWESETEFMLWVTQQADDTEVRIIGVEHLPVEQVSDYRSIPVRVTIRGDYNPLGRFINRLERSPRAILINSLRIRRKEYTPEHMIMDLSTSYFQKVVESL